MRLTRQQAINQNCKDCNYDPQAQGGTWREQIENCPTTECPFYEYRPITYATTQAHLEERKANMTPEQLAAQKAKADRARQNFSGEPAET